MNFLITCGRTENIVRVLFYGVVGLEERLVAAQKLVAQYCHRRPLRVLIDLRQSRCSMTLEEQREFGRFLARHPVLGRARMAVLHCSRQYTSQLITAEARGRGHNSRQFMLESEALAWLST